MKLLHLVVGFSAAATPLGAQQYPPLLDAGTRELLHESLSGEIAKDHVIAITRHHRIQGSRGYRDAANYVLGQLRGYGYADDEAFVESFASDGRVHYQTWQSPSGWDIESAELRMVEPFDERIVSYPEIAMSVITYSNPGDVTAELVWVGSGTRPSDYEGVDVEGKFVLATGYGGNVHRLAVLQHGAAGVVAYLDDDRATEHPDILQYTGMWPRTEELDRVTFGFNLSNRQGERLRALLESGRRVVVHGRVSGIGLEPYEMDVVVARIPGSDPEAGELVLSAHLDHPKESANDNASGSAAILDMARAFRELIDEGRIPRPRRSIRFVWVPEWYGTMAYIDAHPELVGPGLGGTVLANINMDMVGEHLEMLHSRFIVTETPASIPSALNEVVLNMAQMVDGMDVRTTRGSLSRFNFAQTPYSGGSDHMMLIDRRVPGVMFGHSPDYTHHTSDDTPDRVDPVELERSEIIAAAAVLFLSEMTDAEAIDLVHLVAADGLSRAETAAGRAVMALRSDSPEPGAWFEARNVVLHTIEWEKEALNSILTFAEGAPVAAAVARGVERLNRIEPELLEEVDIVATAAGATPGPPEGWADERVPVRLTRGPLDFGLPESRLDPTARAWYGTSSFTLGGSARFELVNFIDGERTVTEIRDALSAEFSPVPTEVVGRYLEDLVTVGVIDWRD